MRLHAASNKSRRHSHNTTSPIDINFVEVAKVKYSVFSVDGIGIGWRWQCNEMAYGIWRKYLYCGTLNSPRPPTSSWYNGGRQCYGMAPSYTLNTYHTHTHTNTKTHFEHTTSRHPAMQYQITSLSVWTVRVRIIHVQYASVLFAQCP